MSFLKKLFGFSSTKVEEPTPAPTPAKSEPPKHAKPDDRYWVAESVLQYVASPAFSNDLEDFKEENCITFSGEEESTHEQYAIFKRYTALLEDKLKRLITILGVTDKEFCDAAYLCYKDGRYRRLMEEVFSAEDYQWFRRTMVRKNRMLEGEIQRQNGRLTKAQMVDQEQKEFEHALALSKKMYDEYLRQIEGEEMALQEALAASRANYEAELGKRQTPKARNENGGDMENVNLIEQRRAEALKRKVEIQAKLDQENEELSKRLEELQKLKLGGSGGQDKTDGQDAQPQASGTTGGEAETHEERRERLLKQRETLLKSRKETRQQQLTAEAKAVEKKMNQTNDQREKMKHKQIYEELLKEKVL